jgi:hypothetical protein
VNRFVYFCVLNGCTSMCGHACLLVACMCASDLHAGRLGVVCAMHARAACAFACFCASRALRGDVVCIFMNACALVDACGCALVCRGGGCTQAECARALKELALPRATTCRVSHSGAIALSSSRRMRSAHAAAPVLFVHAVVTVAENRTSATLTCLCTCMTMGARAFVCMCARPCC